MSATKSKTRANNDMAAESARSFTIVETKRYAGSRGDIARMASNYAGVSFANDSRNDIENVTDHKNILRESFNNITLKPSQ